MSRQNIRFSFALSLLFLFLFAYSGERGALAQSNVRIFHTQQHEAKSDSYLGRDLWFAIPQNYLGSEQKYFNVYVNSPRNTTVNFQVGGGPVVRKAVTAGKVAIFKTPTPKSPAGDFSLTTEITTSGVVEPKSVHIWSDNADIAAYFLSRRDFSSDGMYVVPTTGWGNEYVVGAYASLLIPVNQGDLPSEFAIVSNQDNTTITITPSQDLRKDGFPNIAEHPKGVPFSVNLNRGECIQYQVTAVQDENWDVSGTVITSNNPIGVMGASVCPFILSNEPSCDYILDMMQPTRTWSNTYFTAPFAGRKFGGDGFLLVGSKAGQIIYQNGIQAAIVDKYMPTFVYDVPAGAALWTSDASFMLVQYVCSSTHQAPSVSTRNQGDPAMVVVNAADLFSKKTYFQTPTIDLASGQTEFTNYVNILLPTSHESNTTYDGVLLSAGPLPPNIIKRERFPVPNTGWEAIRLTYKANSGEGSHQIASDTGVGVYLYGYGTDDSYAWAGALGTRTHADPDTIPPIAIAGGPCFCAHVRISDTGPVQSKLSSFVSDSTFNMTFYPDPKFIPGAGTDSSYYDMCVIDSSLEAYLSVSIYDIAGNRTTVISQYKPQFASISPNPLNFGTVNVGNTAFKYDTICNTGQNPFHFVAANLNLSNGTKSDALGFTIDSTGADGDIPVGGCRVIKISFASTVPPTVKDTMTLSDECVKTSCTLIGNGGAADFDVHPYAFDCTPLKAGRPSQNYLITNPSGIDIQIDSIWLDDNVNFGYNVASPATNDYRNGKMIIPNSNTLSGQYQIVVTFSPQQLGFIQTPIHVKAKGGSVKVDTISGYGCAPQIVSTTGIGLSDCGFPYSFKIPLQNTGTYFDSLNSITGNSTVKGFSAIQVVDGNGNQVNLPYHLDSGAVVYAAVDYTPPAKACGTFTDTIVTTRSTGEIANKTQVTVKVGYREANVARDNVNYGNIAFGSAKVQDYTEVCNSAGCDSLIITAISSLSAPGTSSFTLNGKYQIGTTNVTLPVGLAPGECLDIYADFDPALSNVPVQTDSFGIVSNACNGAQTAHVLASISTAPPPVTGFTSPAVLSCDVRTDSVTLTNINSATSETITAISITGPDKANFTSVLAPPIVVGPGVQQKLPILFSPQAQAGLRNYTAWVKLTVTDGAGNTKVDSALVTAIGQGVDLNVASQFANPVAVPGTDVALPIQLSLNKHGLTFPLTALDITRIELTYAYDQNILDIIGNNIKNAVTLTNSSWSVDLATSKVDPVAGTLQLNISGPALADADLTKPIGTISFKASLPKSGSATDVKLTASNFINSALQPLGNCMTVARVDSNFTLIYICGDSTLQKFMNGGNVFSAAPVQPNPAGSAHGNILSFKYAARVQGTVSLAIYDELGKEVARIIRNEFLPAGAFEIRYNSSSLSAGTYVYRFALNNTYVTSGKFVIQK